MRRIVLWLAVTVTIVVLLFGYRTSTNRAEVVTSPVGTGPGSGLHSSSSGGSGTGSGEGSGGSDPGGSGAPRSSQPGSGASGSAASGVYPGSVAQTRWGPVQVTITVQGRKITKVEVPQYPDGNDRDAAINDYALPVLVQETIDAQGAGIDMVSGATVTSDGYVRSLQSALDKAGL